MNRYRLALATSRGDPWTRQRLTRARGDGGAIALSRFRQGGMRGDPFFGAIGKALGGALKFVKGGLGALGPKQPAPTQPPGLGFMPMPGWLRGIGVGGKRDVPFPIPGLIDDPNFGDVVSGGSSTAPRYSVDGGVRRRYRRMNPLNPKALTRAGRRVRKFVDFARSMGALAKSGPVKRSGKRRRR